jgi:hypothetical protein
MKSEAQQIKKLLENLQMNERTHPAAIKAIRHAAEELNLDNIQQTLNRINFIASKYLGPTANNKIDVLNSKIYSLFDALKDELKLSLREI